MKYNLERTMMVQQ